MSKITKLEFNYDVSRGGYYHIRSKFDSLKICRTAIHELFGKSIPKFTVHLSLENPNRDGFIETVYFLFY